MYYRVDRTYLTNAAGESETQHDEAPYFVAAAAASAAATAFVTNERGRLLGNVSSFTGDKATATAWIDGRLYIVFVERGAESIRLEQGESAADSRQ